MVRYLSGILMLSLLTFLIACTNLSSPVKVTEMWAIDFGILGGIVKVELIPTSNTRFDHDYHVELWAGERFYEERLVSFGQAGEVKTLDFELPFDDKAWALMTRGQLVREIFSVKVSQEQQ